MRKPFASDAQRSAIRLSPANVACGLALAIVGFAVPLVLNQLVNFEILHELHKILAYISAFIVFVVWINVLKRRSRRRSPTS